MYGISGVLSINMLNEKIFVILWLWFLLVATCTILSLVNILMTLLPSYSRYRKITDYVKAGFVFSSNGTVVGYEFL